MIPTWGAAFGANAIFNSAEFRADLTHSAVPDKAAPGTTATFTRATTATVRDNEGVLRTCLAGEARFEGARRIYNKLTNTGWSDAASGTYGTVPTGWTADVGTGTLTVASSATYTGHNQITFTATAQRPFIRLAVAVAAYSVNILSVRVVENASGEPINDIITGSSVPAGSTETYSVNGSTVAASYVPVAGDVIEYKIATAATAGTPNWRVGLGCQGAATGSVTLVSPQLEDVTAQTTQTAGEYVSVGVESAPYYHGSFVDGVKCFATDLAGNALPTAYTYDSVSLNGVAGTYVSTPDSAAASITGDIDIRVKAALTDWTPGVENWLVGKIAGAGVRSYDMYIAATTGRLVLRASVDGTVVPQWTSTVSPSVSDGGAIWVRGCRVASTGSVTFYTSADGDAWTQLGDVVAGTSGAIFDSTSVLTIGANIGGVSPTSGKIYQAQIYNGINGTLAVDFNAARYNGGSTLTGSTGETWTLNGNAVIHPTNSPMLGYLAQGARTNLCLQSQTFDNASWSVLDATVTANQAVAPDGTTTADLLAEAATTASHIVYPTLAITFTAGSVYTASVYAKAGTRSWLCVYEDSGGGTIVWFDLANGAVGTTAAATATIESAGSGWYRCAVTYTQSGAAARIRFAVASGNGVVSHAGAITNNIYLWGAQVELGSFASSYIPTTTIAVARNADVLRYSVTNISGALGGAYAEVAANWAASPAVLKSVMATRAGTDIGLWYVSSSNVLTLVDGGVGSGAEKSFTISTTPQKISATWNVAGNSSLGASGGVAGTADTFASTFAPEYIGIGVYRDGTGSQDAHWHGTLRNVRIWQRALSSSELQAITK